MALPQHKSKTSKGKNCENMDIRNDHDSLNASEPNGNSLNFVSNGIANDDNVEDEDSRKYNAAVNIASCKPCSVILQRLSEEEVRILSSKNNLRVKNVRKRTRFSSKSKRRNNIRAIDRKFPSSGDRTSGNNSKYTAKNKLKNLRTRKKREEVEHSDHSGQTIQLISEHNLSCSNQIFHNKPGTPSSEEKFSSDKLIQNRASRKDPRNTTSKVKDGNEPASSDTESFSQQGSESRVTRQKSSSLSLKTKITDIKDDDDCPRQDAHTNILASDNSEELTDTDNNIDGSDRTISLLKRLKFMFEDSLNRFTDEKSSLQKPSIETFQTKDAVEIERSCSSSTDSGTKVAPAKRFRLSLKTKHVTKKGGARRQDPSGEILQSKDSNETSKSITAGSNHGKRMIKRKLEDANGVGALVPEIKKSRKNLTRNDSGEPQKLHSLSNKSSVSTEPNRTDALKGSQLVGNGGSKEKRKHRAGKVAQVVKSLSIPVVRLDKMANPTTSKQIDNAKALDCSIDMNVDKLAPEKENFDTKEIVGSSCFNRTRDTKITDYFIKVDRSSIVSVNDNKNNENLDQLEHLTQKQKYGISKAAAVLLIDFNNLKIPGPKYLASQIEELTLEYANSFPDINFINTKTNTLPSSSVSRSINLPTILNEIMANDIQSSIDITHSPSIHDNTDKPSHDSLQTHSVPISKKASPDSHKSPNVIKHTPVKSTNDVTNREQSFTEFPNLLSVHYRVDEADRGSLQTDTVPIRDKLSRTSPKSPRVNDHTLVEKTQVSLDDNLRSRTPRSGKDRELPNSTERPKDCLAVNEDSAADQEIPDKHLSCEKSFDLRDKPQSSVTKVNQLGHHSSDRQTGNDMKGSLRKPNSHVRKLVLSPKKRADLVNDEKELRESQLHVSDKVNESPETNEPLKSSDHITHTDISEASPQSNKLKAEVNAASVNDPNSKTAMDQPDTCPILPTIVKSPIKVGNLKIPLQHGKSRRLPVNSMTILSREMFEEQSSWMDLDNTIGNVAGDMTPTSKSHTIVEDEYSRTTMKSVMKTSCNATNDGDNNSYKNISTVDIMKDSTGANLCKDNRLFSEPENENSSSAEVVAPENLSSNRSSSSNIVTRSREVNTVTENDTVDEKLDDIQGSDSVAVVGTSSVNMTNLKQAQSLEDSIVRASIDCVDRDKENSVSDGELSTHSQQEGRLIIDTDERDSESQQIEDVPPSTPVIGCSNSSVNATVQDKKTTEETEAASGKVCVLCQKPFKSSTGLEKHLKSHIQCMSGCCLICDKLLDKHHALAHYLEHCGCYEDGQSGFHSCNFCKQKFKTKSGLTSHKKYKHNRSTHSKRMEIGSENESINADNNKCDVCHEILSSKEELFSHLYQHTPQELQAAFESAMARKKRSLSNTTICGKESSVASDNEASQDKEQVPTQSTEATADTSLTSPSSIPNSEVSICTCHQDERLEISGGVIIEVALVCGQCKIFFKSPKCFKDHYNNTPSKCSDKTLVLPKMFCNKCCVILNSLPDMQEHLKTHSEGGDIQLKASILCKSCNIFFFGIGSFFYSHWSDHCKSSLFIADHNSFPNKMKVKIVEPGGPETGDEDEPTECLFLADHQCQKCEKPFQLEADLKKHLNSSDSCSGKAETAPRVVDDPKAGLKIICSMCNKEFIDKSTFDAHMDEHEIIQSFLLAPKLAQNDQCTCSICKVKYNTITDYKNHLIKHEVIREKFQCNYCNLTMVSLEGFKRHSADHKGTSEKPVTCKVIFVMAKFYCRLCKVWFENQSTLYEHQAMHGNVLLPKPKSAQIPMTDIAPATGKASHVCKTCRKEFDDKLKLDAHVSTHEADTSDHSKVDPVVIHLSEDSNSTDVEIIATKTSEENQEPAVKNDVIQEQQKTADIQETKKPSFLRVKNLEELLPYACSKCKSEFDTQLNLSKHICTPDMKPAQAKELKYLCRICKRYQTDNRSDWNLHILTHYPLLCTPKFNESWFYLLKMPNGQKVLRCRMCQNYQSLTIHSMELHFIINHRDVYHPVYECRVCHTFKTDMIHEIRQHETSHFQQSSSLPPLPNSANNLPSAQPVERSTSSPPPLIHFVNSQQIDSSTYKSVLSSSNSTTQSVDSPENVQQVLNSSVSRSDNNPPSLQLPQVPANSQQSGVTIQPENKSNNLTQPILIPPSSSSGGSYATLNLNNFLRPGSNLAVTTSSNGIAPWGMGFQTVQHTANFPPPDQPTRQSDNNSNESQQSIAIPPEVTNSKSDQQSLQPIVNSNNFQPAIWISSVTGSDNNSTSLQLQNFNNSQQQLGPNLQPDNNSNNLKQSISIPPVTGSGGNVSSSQTMENTQWLTTTAQPLQIQINNVTPFNSMTNMMHALPLYVAANIIYTCRICKNYKCSNEQDLKIHEALHELIQLGETTEKCFRCKVCADTFCPTDENLKAHMDICNKSEKSSTLPNQTQQSIVADTRIKCKHCLQTFASSAQLTQHIYSNHTPPFTNQLQSDNQFHNSYPYNCQICSIGFLDESHLHAHMRQIHPGVTLPRRKLNDGKTLYQCDTCGLLLISEATFKYHMKSHNLGYL